MLVHDDIFAWEGWGGRLQLGSGKCRLRIYDCKEKGRRGLTYLRPTIVLVSDMEDSTMSIRSCAGQIATKVTAAFQIDPNRMLFIEYSPAKTYGAQQKHVIEERYEVVEFVWHDQKAIKPKWRPLAPPLLDIVKRIIQNG